MHRWFDLLHHRPHSGTAGEDHVHRLRRFRVMDAIKLVAHPANLAQWHLHFMCACCAHVHVCRSVPCSMVGIGAFLAAVLVYDKAER